MGAKSVGPIYLFRPLHDITLGLDLSGEKSKFSRSFFPIRLTII